MKKLIVSIIVALSAIYAKTSAQVGINTALPAASLDITAKNATGNSPTVDGVLIPRVDRQRAQSMVGVPASTLLYVNSVATGTAAGTAVNIDSMGYYYFDGFVWVKLYNPSNAPYVLGNIYTTDGALNSNRTVAQGAFPLTFTNSLVNGFSVGGNTFSVDALNGRVGIGTAAPHAQIHLGSTVASRKIVMYETGDNDNEFYGFGVNSGIMRYQADRTTTDHVFYAGLTGGAGSNELMRIKGSGNVGIATSTPQKTLHVNGALQVTNELNVGGNASTAGSAGATGQILASNGAGVAPTWKTLNTVSGTISTANYVQGTTALTVVQGTTSDVPGVTITLTVPAGITQTFLFTILGFAPSTVSTESQGAFSLLQNGVKISSAYTSMVSGSQLVRLPSSVTFLKAVTLAAGTYTFKVQYSAWSGDQIVNYNPTNYAGYNGDTEAMLTKMQVLVYNN
ncbi:hypothetical protein [Chryseobacterium sp. ERMR1:04]|uniref:hypothetical protein n=1 Tax=Chryseobacterium sp. ERMR1:04 TaxID=1705393 RepID=UPI0006C8AD2D|nr:hypothetical protein [Chryseobacterium sp. ERMR1:04]